MTTLYLSIRISEYEIRSITYSNLALAIESNKLRSRTDCFPYLSYGFFDNRSQDSEQDYSSIFGRLNPRLSAMPI